MEKSGRGAIAQLLGGFLAAATDRGIHHQATLHHHHHHHCKHDNCHHLYHHHHIIIKRACKLAFKPADTTPLLA